MPERLTLLRNTLHNKNLDGFILPVNDEFMGEYVPDSARRLEWLTGFTGSAGMAVILKDKAAFFTDGRYTLQAKSQVAGFELYNSGEISPEKWLCEQAGEKVVIGYDPRLHTLESIRKYEKVAGNLEWKAVYPNPVDNLWEGRPPFPVSKARIHTNEYAGEASYDKRMRISSIIREKGADAVIITAPDSVCWLLNLRGADVPFTPFLLCNAVVDKSGGVILYIDKDRVSDAVASHLGNGVEIKSPEMLPADISGFNNKRVIYDSANSPVWFFQQLLQAGADIIEGVDPCYFPKARKNNAELEGMRQAHIRDGLAVTRFLYWLDMAVAGEQELTEISVAEKLEEFRKLSDLYIEPSFATISGSGPNGAIVHYHATAASNHIIENNSLLLVDSGGQYRDGTTDITRTIAIGTPTSEMIERFTMVLKGHIALAMAIFPQGTCGSQLDSLARQYLWQAGLDYDHGTGHGVGSHLSVHEGPQRISKRGGDAVLETGMVVSNEPGYYKAGEYGIRIESLVTVRDVFTSENAKCYLGFETITLAPIDMRLVNKSMLNARESGWLEQYHKKVYEAHAADLNSDEKKWLKSFCPV